MFSSKSVAFHIQVPNPPGKDFCGSRGWDPGTSSLALWVFLSFALQVNSPIALSSFMKSPHGVVVGIAIILLVILKRIDPLLRMLLVNIVKSFLLAHL